MSADHKTSPMFNQSIEKGLALLAAFGSSSRRLSVGQLTQAVGITRSSAQRIVFTLETLGYLIKDPHTRRYELSTKVLGVGCNYLASNTLIDGANPFLSALSAACDETVSLMEPCETRMVYVATFPSRKPIIVHMAIGSPLPMYCSSGGRAYLSGLPDQEVWKVLSASDIKALTPMTLTDPDKLFATITAARNRGFATNFEEYYLGHMNVSAPVFNNLGRPVAAVHVTAPCVRWSREEMVAKLGPMVRDCASAITNAVRAH